MSRGQGKIEGRKANDPKDAKICPICGRIFHWRKKWERQWDEVRFCSDRCRRRKLSPLDEALEKAIVRLCRERGRGGSICPSEATRDVSGEDSEAHKNATRDAARRLADQGKIVIMQEGRLIDPSLARGPIRLAIRHE